MQLDISIFRAINSWAGQSAFSDWFWVFATNYLPYILVLATFIVLLIWKKDLITKIKVSVIFVLTGMLSYLLVLVGFNNIWQRLRPFEGLLDVRQLVLESGFSFPSKHAMLVFLLATFVYYFNKKFGIALYVFAIIVAISRVVVGVHYPSDVIGGAILGFILGFVAFKIYKKLRQGESLP